MHDCYSPISSSTEYSFFYEQYFLLIAKQLFLCFFVFFSLIVFCFVCLFVCLVGCLLCFVFVCLFGSFGGGELYGLTRLLNIFRLYRGCLFYWWKKPEYLYKTTIQMDRCIILRVHDQRQEFLLLCTFISCMRCLKIVSEVGQN